MASRQQHDFCALVVQTYQDADMMHMDHPMVMKGNADLSALNGEALCESLEMAVDELDSTVSILPSVASVGVATHSAYAEYEPVRYCGQATAAPKRFYRCFWRSITERILFEQK